jgi:hypothetical protein
MLIIFHFSDISGCSTQTQINVTETRIPLIPTQTNIPVATPMLTAATQTLQPSINCIQINQQSAGSEIHQNNQQKEGALSRNQLSQYLSMKCQLYLPSRLSLALLA